MIRRTTKKWLKSVKNKILRRVEEEPVIQIKEASSKPSEDLSPALPSVKKVPTPPDPPVRLPVGNPPLKEEKPKDKLEKVQADPAPLNQDKVARHWAKAKKGVLRKILELGEATPLREIHAHSERRYFIGHQRFSHLLEELVDEGLVSFDWDQNTASLTDKGRQELDNS